MLANSTTMKQYQQDFIRFSVDEKVLKFGEFTLKSGRKRCARMLLTPCPPFDG